MKLSKRLLSVLLVLVLALTLAMPAFAENGEPPEEPNPAMPVITVQPQGGSFVVGSLLTFFELRVQAHAPNGDPVYFHWYQDGVRVPGALSSFRNLRAVAESGGYHHVVVRNRNNLQYYVVSETVRVDAVEPTFFQRAWQILQWVFWGGFALFTFSPLALAIGIGGALLVAPIVLPITWIVNLFR